LRENNKSAPVLPTVEPDPYAEMDMGPV